MSNKKISKELFNAIQKVMLNTKGKPLNKTLIDSLENDTKPLVVFFNISHFQAIVLSVYLENGIRESEVSTERMINHFGKKLNIIPDIEEATEELIKRKILLIKRNGYRSDNRDSFNKTIQVYDKVLEAVLKGDKEYCNYQKSNCFLELIDEVKELILKRIDGIFNTDILVEEVMAMLEANKNFPEVQWLLSLEGLSIYDITILLNLAIEHLKGEEEVNMDDLIKEVFSGTRDRIVYKRNIKENNSALYKQGLIELSDDILGFLNYVRMSEETMDILLGGFKDSIQNKFIPKTGILIHPDKIGFEKLYYNDLENEHIDTLSKALNNDNYERLMSKLRDNGMRPGFTVLMYGYPGTGKTSSVKQIAKLTDRTIFMVEIQKIQSKWVGESEKNLTKVFDEYRRCKKTFSKTPILLFNEADAILGKRVEVNSSVDKSFNTLQNILLQELEDFEGIFMATTNLAKQLDDAFDRRLLYKVEFKKPADKVREQIFKNVFNDIEPVILNGLNSKYPLTGGQIANIKKKYLVQTLLQNNLDTNQCLIKICEEELSLLIDSKKNPIGFLANS